MEEFFLTLVRFFGLLEQDIAYRFGVTVYCLSDLHKLDKLPLLAIRADLLVASKRICLSTCAKAHESSLMLPSYLSNSPHSLSSNNAHSPATKSQHLQRPYWYITIRCCDIYIQAGSIELTRQSGLLNLLERDDSIMADRGFDILEDLAIRGVRLNIPPFLHGKTHLDQKEMTETSRIASLRIHVERCM